MAAPTRLLAAFAAVAAAAAKAAKRGGGGPPPDFDFKKIMDEKRKKDEDMKNMLKNAGIDTDGMNFGSDGFANMDFSKLNNLGKDKNGEPLPSKLGVVWLDTYTLDDVADGSRTVLLKIDKEYPWGDKEDAWKRFSEKIAKTDGLPDFVLAEVGVQEYGDDKYNEAVAKRFGVEAKDYPAFFLLRKGGGEARRYTGDVTVDALTRFVSSQGGVHLPLAGTVAAFDALAARFVAADGSAEKRAVLREAKGAAEELDDDQQAAAKYYLSVMKKMLARAQGDGVIVGCSDDEEVPDCEQKRIEKALKDRKTPLGKKKTLKGNLNALASFQRG